MKPILIVGAGFAGAVHARTLAEAGFRVHVIDQRPHIAGNAYDYVDDNGIRVHAYGPHLFHTKMPRVIEWVQKFGAFVPYTHKVRALLPSGVPVPLPINLDTVNAVFGTDYQTAEQVHAHLKSIALPIVEPANAAEHLYANIGLQLTDLFFRPYTKKMWGLDLEDMSAAVVKRIPLRTDRKDTYFADDDVQMMPRDGYTKLFQTIFAHENIRVSLTTRFEKSMLTDYAFCFNAMPIDEYFDFKLGELPYRSLKFHHRTEAGIPEQSWSITNFTDTGPITRETAWHLLPHHIAQNTGRHTLTREEPCDYRDNHMERYYPVKTADGRYNKLYDQYKALAADEQNIAFIGRCGTYQYLDMDQVINQSLTHVEAWLKQRA
ncbi:MAG: UDP-galactopyranose mutase [Acidocella sp. 20-57-95]|nr:MAG: UDP-galactopyranose mutase [Acidocella sp. 20-57-95]OYV58875.1 MAG: UDP-galactopyranose mutase [Acidocella sp. 21-58-7]HQT65135.1 UDP-galactopyranose mutase [Acidocella sp.]HQU05063.1 UDP-galactopyranose mutase [Acidocella sp.]